MKSRYKKLGKRFMLRQGETSLDKWTPQKSFYGKCGVTECDGVRVLRSYDTMFAAECGGMVVLLSELPWSLTTIFHFKAFCTMCGVEYDRKRRYRRCLAETDDVEAIASYVRKFVGGIQKEAAA